MEFDTIKCNVVRFGESKNRPLHQYKLGDKMLNIVDRKKDLRMIINRNLSPKDYIDEKG